MQEQRGGRGVRFGNDSRSHFVEPYRGSNVVVGDKFYLRGDQTKPNRIWTVVKTGDKFMTIETKDKQYLPPGQEIRVVTAEDILSIDALPVEKAFSQIPAVGYPTGGIGFMSPQQSAAPTNNIEIRVVQGDDNSNNSAQKKENISIVPSKNEISTKTEDIKPGMKIEKLGS